MSAAEDDTELRDLLVQNLENNGVLNKLKAEMRAAVFLAMEEQDRLENKTPLINENLKKCLNSKDGRLAASLVMDFLQVFNLDFTLAVFQPEINSLNGLESRDTICRELCLSEFPVNKNSPLLLELVREGQHQGKPRVCTEDNGCGSISKEPSKKQILSARKKFDFYDKDRSGCILKEDLKSVFIELFPSLNKSMLETFVTDELRAADSSFSKTLDFQLFLRIYKCLFTQCRVVLLDSDISENQIGSPEDKINSAPPSKDPELVTSLGKGNLQQQASDPRASLPEQQRERLEVSLEVDDDLDGGDSFFDDPLPKPQTYSCVVPVREDSLSGPIISSLRRGKSLNDLSLLAGDSEGDRDDLSEHIQISGLRKVEGTGARESPAGSMSDVQKPGGGGSSASDHSHTRNGASNSREKGIKAGSVHLDEDVEYDDDFNSHRSDLSKSELSIGEEIEEVSIEGPDNSDKFEETTQDLSVSQLSQSHGADYMEDVA